MKKSLTFQFLHRWIGCLQGFSCNIYKCCLHHSTTTKHGNGVAVALLRLCVQYVWNKKGKLFSQAVLCFIIGSVRGCPHCTELASGDCQGRPRSDPRGWWLLLQKTELLEYLTITLTVECFPMWLSSCYGLAVYFSLFDSKLSPMAYSLTFNLLALLCTPPAGRLCVVYCQFFVYFSGLYYKV